MPLDSNVQMWATAISRNQSSGRAIIFRFAKALSPTFDKASQPIRIIIAWKYDSENGQPITREHEQMKQLEDAVESALDADNFATLALVSTGEGLREWIYYAKSVSEFAARFTYAIAEMPELPIEIHSALDPGWDTYEQFRVTVKEVVN
jgi:hypothetical protein